MDKNTIIGIVLIIAIIIVYGILNKPSQEKLNEAKRLRDSLALVEQQKQLEEELRKKQEIISQPAIIAQQTENKKADTSVLKNIYGDFAVSAIGENSFITLENNLLKLTISTRGGRPYSVELKNYKAYNGKPLILFSGDSTVFGFEFFSNNRALFSNDLFFKPVDSATHIVASKDSASTSLRLYAGNDRYIEYVYSLKPDSYKINFKINFVGMENLLPTNTTYLDFVWKMYSPQLEKGAENEANYTTIGYKHIDEEVNELSPRGNKSNININTKLKWIAFKQQFFSSIIVAKNNFMNASLDCEKLTGGTPYLKLFSSKMSVPFSLYHDKSIDFEFYFGPNHFNTMRKYHQKFERLIPLGKNIIKAVNQFLIIPVFNFLDNYIGNYGIVILLLTIFIKIIILPLTYKSYLSSAKMKVLKPQIDEINSKYPKQEDAMKKQQAVMALYKKVGINPLGGCLPLLIQFPILIAMFRFFPASIELRHQSFLWADDLSSYDSILQLPFTVPFGYGNHVSLFTLLMTISTIIYTYLNNQMTAASNQQFPGMKFIMYFMPVMFLFWFNNYAAALSYYYLLTNIFTFIQMWLFKKFVDEEEILRKLNENAKKTPKKSGFQARLEKMARERGLKLPK